MTAIQIDIANMWQTVLKYFKGHEQECTRIYICLKYLISISKLQECLTIIPDIYLTYLISISSLMIIPDIYLQASEMFDDHTWHLFLSFRNVWWLYLNLNLFLNFRIIWSYMISISKLQECLMIIQYILTYLMSTSKLQECLMGTPYIYFDIPDIYS